MVHVWVVKKPIAKGTKSKDIEGSLGRAKIPNNLLANGAVTDLKKLKGLVTNTALVPGEQVLASRFATPSVARQGDVPSGLLQVTVKLDAGSGRSAGRVRVGDSVGVLLSLPAGQAHARRDHLQLHKVLVTSVQISGDASTVPNGTGTEGDAKEPRTAAWRRRPPTACW